MQSIDYYCGIDDLTRLERELVADGAVIISRRMKQFIDGPPEEQLTISWPDGYYIHIFPTGKYARARQQEAGRWLPPYQWVSFKPSSTNCSERSKSKGEVSR